MGNSGKMMINNPLLDFRVPLVFAKIFVLRAAVSIRFPTMSGAQHGYVDPSSTDKGAADETAEVDLQVLCLTGEGVALSVPRSMLGYDLRRLMSEKLPCKPGAKLAVHHVIGKLALDQTLGEQGIAGKSAMLSCTYIPTNVYTAWCYVCGLPTCERERLRWKVLRNLRESQVENI